MSELTRAIDTLKWIAESMQHHALVKSGLGAAGLVIHPSLTSRARALPNQEGLKVPPQRATSRA